MLAFGIYAKGRSDFPTICIKFCPTRFQDGGLQTKASFLEWRGKRGIFRFFRRVPPDIVDLVGFSFWERSLRTSDEQAAAIKARALAVETDEVIRQARAEREQMAKAAERFREADAKVAGLPKSDQNEIFRLGGAQGLLADTLDDVGQHNFMLAAADMLDPSRFGDEELSDHVRLRLGKMDAASSRSQLDVIGSEITRRTATLRKLSIEVETLAKFRTNDPGIEAVVAHYCAAAKLPEQTRRQYGYAARRFAELHGDLSVRELRREHLRIYAEAAAWLPKTTDPDIAALSIKEAAKLAREKGLATISTATVAKHLTALKTAGKYAASVGWVENDPFAGFRLVLPRKRAGDIQATKRLPFTSFEVKRILDELDKRYGPSVDDYWPPIVAAYTGGAHRGDLPATEG